MTFTYTFIITVLIAIACGTIVGIERQIHGSPAGLRTHMLVCLGASLTSLISIYVSQSFTQSGDIFRIAAQVISGIGFLGAGMIIFRHYSVLGLTTAAGIWTVAIIGIIAGFGYYLGAIVTAVIVLLINSAILSLERYFHKVAICYLEIDDMTKTNEILKILKTNKPHYYYYRVTQPKSATPGHIGLVIKIKNLKPEDFEYILSIDHILFVSED